MRLCLGLSLLLVGPLAAQAPPVETLVIRHVTVIDGTAAAPQQDRTVLVENGHITAISAGDLEVTGTPRELDGTGRFLIPGLWDMHVHMTAMPSFAELFVANGVTGVRDMFSIPQQIELLRRSLAAGKRPGPRIVAAGRIVDGEPPVWPGSLVATDAESATRAVATAVEQGSEFVKVYSRLPRAAYFAIVAECRKRGLPFAGHVPGAVTAMEAVVAGQRTIEHLTGVLEACSQDVDRAHDASLPKAERQELLAEAFADDKVTEFAALCRQHGTSLCPTLTVLRAIAHLDDATFTADERVQFVPAFLQRMWLPANDRRFQTMTADDWARQRRVYAQQRGIVQRLIALDAPFLVGTDTGNPYCFPGFSLHDELRLLVELGLSPQRAITAATLDAARCVGLDAEIGTIAVGKVASLVLLDQDPMQDIGNTTKIRAVVVEGRLLDRDRLDALLVRTAPAGK